VFSDNIKCMMIIDNLYYMLCKYNGIIVKG